MNEARLQQVLGKGYAIAAARVGSTFELYRPSAFDSVLEPINLIAASFKCGTAAYGNGFGFEKPDQHRDHYNNLLGDTRIMQKGDYLVSVQYGTWFVADMPSIKPALGVRCDRVLTVKRAGSAGTGCTTVGLSGYSGPVAANEADILIGWPASLMEVGGRARGNAGLPIDAGAPSVEIMMPALPDVMIEPADVIACDLGRRYIVKGAELSKFGWKIMAVEAVA